MNDASFHEMFATALQHATADTTPLLKSVKGDDQRRRFNIYRNNRTVSLIETLRGSYPALNQLVGDEFFKAAARAFIDTYPPVQPVMAEYGREFGSFMSSLPNAEELPFLNDIAELEWSRLQAYHCMDAPVLQPIALADVAPDSIMDIRLQWHPALHCVVSEWPIGSIWAICSDDSKASSEADNRVDMLKGETVVITRPNINVLINKVTESASVFLNAIQQGETLGDAAEQGLGCDENFDAGEHLTGLMALGAFTDIIDI